MNIAFVSWRWLHRNLNIDLYRCGVHSPITFVLRQSSIASGNARTPFSSVRCWQKQFVMCRRSLLMQGRWIRLNRCPIGDAEQINHTDGQWKWHDGRNTWNLTSCSLFERKEGIMNMYECSHFYSRHPNFIHQIF